MTIKVSIVEDDAGVREGLIRVLGRARDFQCLSSYCDAESALQDLPQVKPDVVIMDINLPKMNGVECARKLKAKLPGTQIMMVTVYEDPERIFEALAAGATGYLLKQTPPPGRAGFKITFYPPVFWCSNPPADLPAFARQRRVLGAGEWSNV